MLHEIFSDPNVQSALHALLITVATVGAGVVTVAVKKFVKSNVSAADLANIETVAREAVLFAEQTGAAATGEQKLAAAMAQADVILTRLGISITAEELRTAIEAAVFHELTRTT